MKEFLLNFWMIICGISILITGIFLLKAALVEDGKPKIVLAFIFWYFSFVSACMVYIGTRL